MADRQRRRIRKRKERQERVKTRQSALRAYSPPLTGFSDGPLPKIMLPTGFGMPNLLSECLLFLTSRLLEQQNPASMEETQAYLNTFLNKPPEELAALSNIELDSRAHAQYLTYQANHAEDGEVADRFIAQALEIDPECTDALLYRLTVDYIDFDQLEHVPVEDLVQILASRPEKLAHLVRLAEQRLGPEYFQEWHGRFWNITSRPFMRAMAGLGYSLHGLAKLDQNFDPARRVYERMLDLNPNDNQGIRDRLLCLYLGKSDTAAARDLFGKYAGELSAVFCFGRVLERLQSNDPASARRLLRVARRENSFVEECLLDPESLPDVSDYYVHGDFDEAVYCSTIQLDAWEETPNALEWLEEQLTK